MGNIPVYQSRIAELVCGMVLPGAEFLVWEEERKSINYHRENSIMKT